MVVGPSGGLCRRSGAWVRTLVIALLAIALAGSIHAESEDERRVKAGARLFRAILSADLAIADKTDAEGQLAIVVIESGRDSFAELAADIISPPPHEGVAKVKGIPLRTIVVRVEDLASLELKQSAGIFLAGRVVAEDLVSVIEFAEGQRVIAFSPFEGDVEQGILGGLSIEARVKPYVNGDALVRSGVHLKEKFLKVAKLYQ